MAYKNFEFTGYLCNNFLDEPFLMIAIAANL